MQWSFGGSPNKTMKQPGYLMWGFGLCLQRRGWIWCHAAMPQLFPETPLSRHPWSLAMTNTIIQSRG